MLQFLDHPELCACLLNSLHGITAAVHIFLFNSLYVSSIQSSRCGHLGYIRMLLGVCSLANDIFVVNNQNEHENYLQNKITIVVDNLVVEIYVHFSLGRFVN